MKVTAGRILKGQLENRNGEEEITVMESLEHNGFSKVIQILNNIYLIYIMHQLTNSLIKTYNIDAQTADSAGKFQYIKILTKLNEIIIL